MGELHHSMSMAFTNSSLHSSSLGWDCHSHLGVLNTDRMSLAMEEYMMMNAAFYSSPHVDQSDFSTGYLEDALVEFSERSKRRRLLAYTDGDNELKDSSTALLAKGYWNSDWEVSENFDCMSQLTTSSSGPSVLLGDPVSITTPMSRLVSEEITNDIVGTKINTPEEPTMSAPEAFDSFSSSSSKDSANTNSDYLPAPKETFLTNIAVPAVGGGGDEKKKKKEGDNKGGLSICVGEAGRSRGRRDLERHQRENPNAANTASTTPSWGLCVSTMRVCRWPWPFWQSCGGPYQDSNPGQRHNHYYQNQRLN